MPDPTARQKLLNAWWTLTGRGDFAGTVSLPMLTGSMAPSVPVGSELHIASARGRSCGVGDVVVFQQDERLVAHRLLLCLGTGPRALCYEKGDLNADGGWIRRSDILGVVVDRTPPVGTPQPPPLVPAGIVLRSLKRALRAKVRRWLGREAADAPPTGGPDDG